MPLKGEERSMKMKLRLVISQRGWKCLMLRISVKLLIHHLKSKEMNAFYKV